MQYFQDDNGQWWGIYRNKKTKATFLKCTHCGKDFLRSKYYKKSRNVYCSRICSNKTTAKIHQTSKLGVKNYRWKGGRRVVKKGYIRIYMPEHPNSAKDKTILEHRYVMEHKLGRYLLPKETVHHINGIRDDNRPENLELFVSSHPSGQRVEDLIKWAKEILAIYDKQ